MVKHEPELHSLSATLVTQALVISSSATVEIHSDQAAHWSG
jgi:hypothetical protein